MSAAATIAAIGAGMQLYGQIKASKSQAKALKSEAEALAISAKGSEMKAQADAEAQQIQSMYVKGGQVADFAAAGVEGGSVFAVMANTAINAEMDRLNILFGGKVRAKELMAESQAKLGAAKDVKDASLINTLATGATIASIFAKG